jgi:hypothetical protein
MACPQVADGGDALQIWNMLNKLSHVTKDHKKVQIKEDEMGRSYNTNGEKRNACRILVRKAEGKRPL